jgi:hypothetical protein
MKTTPKKIIALTLCSLMLMGSFGGISEAYDRDDSPPPPPRHHEDAPPPPPRHHEDAPRHQDEGHSSGDVTTAAIVGAVIGAVIAKVT